MRFIVERNTYESLTNVKKQPSNKVKIHYCSMIGKGRTTRQRSKDMNKNLGIEANIKLQNLERQESVTVNYESSTEEKLAKKLKFTSSGPEGKKLMSKAISQDRSIDSVKSGDSINRNNSSDSGEFDDLEIG